MKMSPAFIVSVLLICCSITSSAETPGAGCEKFSLAGANFMVRLSVNVGATDRLSWKRNGEKIFHKRGASVTLGKPEDISDDGSLQLQQVSKEMEGTYEAEVHKEDGKSLGTFKTVLCVEEHVNKPTLKARCESDKVKFTCSVNPVTGVSFRWHQNGKPLKDEGVSVKLSAEKVGTDTVTCTVSNRVSNMSSEALGQNCIKSVWVLPELIDGISSWVFVGAGGGVVLILFTVVIVCCIRTRRRQRMHVKDEEELRLGWTNPNQQHPQHHHPHPSNQQHPQHHHPHPSNQQHPQHHHPHPPNQQHHHHQQQQPAGHTGPRPHRNKQQRPRNPNQPGSQPQPSPRRQAPREADEEQPPPLPQPRKKAPRV